MPIVSVPPIEYEDLNSTYATKPFMSHEEHQKEISNLKEKLLVINDFQVKVTNLEKDLQSAEADYKGICHLLETTDKRRDLYWKIGLGFQKKLVALTNLYVQETIHT